MTRKRLLLIGLFALVPGLAFGGAIVRTAAGLSPASIQAAVDQFRVDLGSANNGVGGSFPSGHREVNWDGVPDALSAPANLPANFFNSNSPRGIVFSTPGTGFQVSAKAGNPTVTAVRFGNINPTYTDGFQTFSPERLFVALGSNITDATFFIPGSSTNAFVSGFGAVFTDVDFATTTTIQFFDPNGNSLGTFAVPATLPGSQNMSFVGVSFNAGERVARVRITSGNTAPGPDDNSAAGMDVVAMDDFLYGEPQSLQAGCVTDASSLCLNGGRFRVQATFRAPGQSTPLPATALGITSDTGAFSFFSAGNLELLVKVVDGRPVNGRFWVFIGSTTNVEFTVTVTDMSNNATKTYTNPQGSTGTIIDLQSFGPPLPPPPSACPIEEGGLASCDPNGTLFEGTGVNNTSTVIGRVVGPDGVPIANAIVSTESGYRWSAHDWCHAETTTDAQGNFTLNATGVRPFDWGFFSLDVKIAAPVGTKTLYVEASACPTSLGTIVLP